MAERVLLTIDVGNTNTVIGCFHGEALIESWRIKTDTRATADELALLLRGLLSGCGGDGRPLVKPVLRADPRGLLLAEPLVRALDATGRRSGADLLGAAKTATAFDMAVAAVDAGKPEPKGYSGSTDAFRRMIDTEELDLVYTATPWEWHAPVMLAAMRAGRHAATEVPMVSE